MSPETKTAQEETQETQKTIVEQKESNWLSRATEWASRAKKEIRDKVDKILGRETEDQKQLREQQEKQEILNWLFDPSTDPEQKKHTQIINSETGTIREIVGFEHNKLIVRIVEHQGKVVQGKMMLAQRSAVDKPKYQLIRPTVAPEKTQEPKAKVKLERPTPDKTPQTKKSPTRSQEQTKNKIIKVGTVKFEVGEPVNVLVGKQLRQGTVLGIDKSGNLLVQAINQQAPIVIPPDELSAKVGQQKSTPLGTAAPAGAISMGDVAQGFMSKFASKEKARLKRARKVAAKEGKEIRQRKKVIKKTPAKSKEYSDRQINQITIDAIFNFPADNIGQTFINNETGFTAEITAFDTQKTPIEMIIKMTDKNGKVVGTERLSKEQLTNNLDNIKFPTAEEAEQKEAQEKQQSQKVIDFLFNPNVPLSAKLGTIFKNKKNGTIYRVAGFDKNTNRTTCERTTPNGHRSTVNFDKSMIENHKDNYIFEIAKVSKTPPRKEEPKKTSPTPTQSRPAKRPKAQPKARTAPKRPSRKPKPKKQPLLRTQLSDQEKEAVKSNTARAKGKVAEVDLIRKNSQIIESKHFYSQEKNYWNYLSSFIKKYKDTLPQDKADKLLKLKSIQRFIIKCAEQLEALNKQYPKSSDKLALKNRYLIASHAFYTFLSEFISKNKLDVSHKLIGKEADHIRLPKTMLSKFQNWQQGRVAA